MNDADRKYAEGLKARIERALAYYGRTPERVELEDIARSIRRDPIVGDSFEALELLGRLTTPIGPVSDLQQALARVERLLADDAGATP